jgi:hypothetical protein
MKPEFAMEGAVHFAIGMEGRLLTPLFLPCTAHGSGLQRRNINSGYESANLT